MNIELHIERLVVEGIDIPPGHGGQLREDVGAELIRLLRDGGLADSVTWAGAVARLRAPAVTVPAGSGLGDLGRQLGGAIYEGLTS
jgi:hypothetical protein